MKYPLKRFLPGFFLILSASLPPACFAEAAEEPRHFEIELLVFRNLIENDGGEVWPIDYSGWFEEAGDDTQKAARNTSRIDWLPESGYRLTAQRNALGRSAQYRPVA